MNDKAVTTAVQQETSQALTIGEEIGGLVNTQQEMARYAAEAEIKAAVVLARQFPRSNMRAYGLLMESCKRPAFANEVRYSFPRSGSKVEGPSVVLAREAARCWGNIRYGVDVTYDDPHRRKVQAWAWDIESNTKVTHEDEFEKLVQRAVWENGKKTGTTWVQPDERDLRELTNRRAAMAVRNCILQLIPRDFIEDALEEAANTIAKAAKTSPQDQLKKIVKGFSSYRVTTPMLERKLGHSMDEITPEEVVELHGIYTSIKEGNSTVGEHFGSANKEPEGTIPAEGNGSRSPAEALRETPEARKAKGQQTPKGCSKCGQTGVELAGGVCMDCASK